MHSTFICRLLNRYLLWLLISFSSITAAAQMQPVSDSCVPKKHFWKAGGELLLVQVIPWSVNYFIRDAEFAHISISSILHNLNLANWEWDDNNFLTNQFAHPYQGNLYFNSFRTNGYSFWQSVPAAFAGSFIWEVAWETHNGAPNDFINTSLGGIALGEMTYRVSSRVVNEQQRGFKRQMQEVAAFLINPVYGFNRIVNGKWGRYRYQPQCPYTPLPLHGTMDMGMRRFSEKTDDLLSKGKNEWYARLQLQYGNRYQAYKKPFDQFSLSLEIGGDDTARINTINVAGSLYGWPLKTGSRTTHLAEISMNYDYYRNAAFFYGGQSVNMNLLSTFTLGRQTQLYTQLGAGPVILSAIPDQYLYYGEGRNYDYGTGLSMLFAGRLQWRRRCWLSLQYRGGYSKTLNGSQSSYLLNALTTEARYDFGKIWTASVEWGHFSLNGYYRKEPDVSHKYPYLRASAGIRF